MSDSPEEQTRFRKREWARRDRERRAAEGELSYTSEWRRLNTELYENQKTRTKERRKIARQQEHD